MFKNVPDRTQTRFPNEMASPTSQTSLLSSFLPALLPTSVVATSAVRDAYSSASLMKCFKWSNVKTSPTTTPSFAKAKLLKVFLTGVRILEERLATSLVGDLHVVRASEKLDDKEVRLVRDGIGKMCLGAVRNMF